MCECKRSRIWDRSGLYRGTCVEREVKLGWCSACGHGGIVLGRHSKWPVTLDMMSRRRYGSYQSNTTTTTIRIIHFVFWDICEQFFLIIYPLKTVVTQTRGSAESWCLSVWFSHFHVHSFAPLTLLSLPSGLLRVGFTIEIPYAILASKFLPHAQITTVP